MRKSKNRGAHSPGHRMRRLLCVFLAAALFMTTGLDALAADSSADTRTVTGEVSGNAEDTALGVDLDEVSVEDAETDPVVETYIEENADETYTDTADMVLVNFIAVKQTFFDRSLVEDSDTIDSIMTDIEGSDEEIASAALDKYIMQTAGYTAVYELDEDSDYFVAFIDTMSESSVSETKEAVFAVNNNDGVTVDGCIYDAETGIAYIPKDLLLNDAGEQVLLYLQVQLMQLMDTGSDTTQITVTVNNGKDILSSEETDVGLYDTDTVVTIDIGLPIESVSVDGTPVTEEYYAYDADSGELVINESPTSVQSISITTESSGIMDRLLSLASDAFTEEAYALSSYNEMSYFAYDIDIGDMAVNDYYDFYVGYEYSSEFQHASTIYGAPTVQAYHDELVAAIEKGGAYTVTLSHIVALSTNKVTNCAVWLNRGNSPNLSSFNAGLGSISSRMVLQCTHIENALGKYGYTYGTVVTDLKARIRLLYKGTDSSGYQYAVLGIITQMTNGQSGAGLFKVRLQTKGRVYIRKVSDNSSSTDGNSNYSLAGAKYQIFSSYSDAQSAATGADSNNTKRIATLTTDSSGITETVSLDAGTYYVKEIVASKGFDLDTDIYTVTVSSGKTSVVKSTEPMKTGSLTIYKYSKDTSATDDNGNYDLSGAVFGIYTNSACSGTAYKTVTLGDQEGSYSSGTVSGLPYGTYYVKEITPPTGYLLSTPDIQTVIVNSSTAAVKVGYYNPPLMVTLKIVKETDFSDAAISGAASAEAGENELALHKDYSLEDAVFGVYSTEEDAQAMMNPLLTITTDENGEGTASKTLAMGTYYVREITAPKGYRLNDEIYTVTADNSAVSSSNMTVELEVNDSPETGMVSVYKHSDDNSLLENYPDYYFLEGAQYTVYYSSTLSSASIAGVITTDENGYGELDGILYGRTSEDGYVYIRETRAPTKTVNGETVTAKFDLDTTVYKAKITADNSSAVVESTDPAQSRTLYVYKGPLAMLETGADFTRDIPDDVTDVVFTSGKTIPDDAVDVSFAQNGGIMAWQSGTTWYVQSVSGGAIYFNYDSSYMFCEASGYGGHSLTSIDFGTDVINTMYVTTMAGMFTDCQSLTSIDVSEFDTGNVTSMSEMFAVNIVSTTSEAQNETPVTGLTEITGFDSGKWDTSSVTDMSFMFQGCDKLASLDLSTFDTGNVTNMRYMFYHCISLTALDLSGFDMARVTRAESMFSTDFGLVSIDTTGWDVGNVTSTANMFYFCTSLKTITGLESWKASSVEECSAMFTRCSYLTAEMTWYSATTTTIGNLVFAYCCTASGTGFTLNYVSSETEAIAEEMVATRTSTNVKLGVIVSAIDTSSVLTAAAEVEKTQVRSAASGIRSAVSAAVSGIMSTASATVSGIRSAAAAAASGIQSAAAMVSGGSRKGLLSKLPEKPGLVTEALAETADRSLTNAVYSAYYDEALSQWFGDFTYVETIVDTNGEEVAVYAICDVPYGLSLWVKEEKASTGYLLDEHTYEYGANAGDGTYANSTEIPGGDEEAEYGTIQLRKSSSDTGMTANNSNYSLAGAEYTVYTDSGCTTPLATDGTVAILTTDEYGVANRLENVSFDTYYIVETKTPEGYEQDPNFTSENPYEVVVSADDPDQIVYSRNEPPVYGSLHIYKQSSNNTITDGNDNYSLKGAVFGIYTDEDCTELYKTVTTDDSGFASLSDVPLGTWYVTEIVPPPGYELPGWFEAEQNGQKVKATVAEVTLTESNRSDGIAATFYNEPETGTIVICKYSDNTSVTSGNAGYSLEGAVFEICDSEGELYATLTTDEYGYASVSDVPLGTYTVKETGASKGYRVSSGTADVTLSSAALTYTVPFAETPDTMTVEVLKSSSDSSLTDGNDNYSLEGAMFGVYSDESCDDAALVTTIETDKEGKGESAALAIGTYYMKEIRAPQGYGLNESICRAVGAEDGAVTYTDLTTGETVTSAELSVEDVPETAKLRIYKESGFSDLTDGTGIYYDEAADTYTADGLDTYTIAGAVYGVYASEDDATGDIVDTSGQGTTGLGYLTTAEDGYTEYLEGLAYGIYYVKETLAPKGYETDENLYTVEITSEAETAADSSGEEVVVIHETEESGTGEAAVTLVLSDSPAYADLVIDVTKEALPAEMADISTLEGAQFTIRYYDGYYTEGDLADAETAPAPTRAWVINVSCEDGRYFAKLDEEHLQADISDELYYDHYTVTENADGSVTITPDGSVILPLGTYIIEETLSPENYTLEGSWYDTNTGEEIADVTGDAVNAVLLTVSQEDNGSTASLSLSNELTKEDTAFGSVTIIKKDSEGNLLEGVEFTLYMYSEEIDSWNSVEVGTTDENGTYVFENLPFGTYRIRETAALDGMTLLAEPIEFTIPYRMTVEAVEAAGNNVDLSGAFLVEDDTMYDFLCLTYTVTDGAEFSLPSAGVSPAIPITLAVGLAALAFGLFTALRRKRGKKNLL